MLGNQTSGYGWISILLHWVLALLILGLFGLGVWMVELSYYSTWYHDAPFIHKSLGVTVVMLMAVRLLWNRFQVKPVPLAHRRFEILSAKTVHGLLYLLVFLLGISGYLIATAEGHAIHVFGWFEWPAWVPPFAGQADLAGAWHQGMAYGLMALVLLHALAALKHHFWDRDDTLKRMCRPPK